MMTTARAPDRTASATPHLKLTSKAVADAWTEHLQDDLTRLAQPPFCDATVCVGSCSVPLRPSSLTTQILSGELFATTSSPGRSFPQSI